MGQLLDIAKKALNCKRNIRRNPFSREVDASTTREPTDERNEITKKGYAPTLDGKPGNFNADDYVVIPWPIYIDPLHTGRLTGKVPSGWSREGWIMVTRDRMTHTNDEVVLGLLRAELSALERETELDSILSEAEPKRQYGKGCGAKGINGVGGGTELKRKPNTGQHGDNARPSVESRANHVVGLDSLYASATQEELGANWDFESLPIRTGNEAFTV